MIKPSYLKKNDLIGITCPAGYMPAEKAEACITTLQQWGYIVMVGKTLGSNSKTYFSGTDDERLNELQAMLDDTEIKAILFGRGGYGMGRIVDRLNFNKFKRHPKWLIGFSDITVLHSHVFKKLNIASLHAPMAAAFNEIEKGKPYLLSLKNALAGKQQGYTIAPHSSNRIGTAKGILVGGNLTLLVNTIGTASQPDYNNKILFIEDIGEYLYGVDRMLWQMKRAGIFKKLLGLIFGGFTDMKDTKRPFGKTVDEILSEIVGDVKYPVCFNFPVSHGIENYALVIGGTYKLTVTTNVVRLKEL